MKLQAGMAFECELEEKKIKGRIAKFNNDYKYTLTYKDQYGANRYYGLDSINNKGIKNFRIISITLDLLQVGDVIKNEDGKRKVLGRLNDLIFISLPKKYNITTKGTFHIDELKRECFEIIQPEWEEKPKARGMTLREIELELGYKIRIEEVTP